MHTVEHTPLDSKLRKFLFALGIPKRNYCKTGAVTVSVFVNMRILIDLRRLTGLVFVNKLVLCKLIS